MHWLKPLSPRGVSSAGDNNDTQVAWLRVAQGQAQPYHITMARMVFAQHLNEISFSLAGYHTLDYRMTDGSTLRIVSNSGIHQAVLWPVNYEPTEGPKRGFVLAPKLQDDALFTYAQKTALVWYITGSPGDWSKKESPYELGKDATPTYFVEEDRRTSPDGGVIETDSPYADVLTLSEGSLYLNSLPYTSFAEPATDSLALRLITEGAADVWFAVANEGAQHLDTGALVDLWTRAGSSIGDGPSGYVMEPGVKYIRPDETATYATLRLLDTGAFQRRYAEIVLQRTSPWYTTAGVQFAQIDVPAAMITTLGYSSVTTPVPSTPFEVMQNENATMLGGEYAWIVSGVTPLVDTIYSGTQSTDNTIVRLEYIRTLPAPDNGTITLMPGISATWDRGVSINAVHETSAGNSVLWYNDWELGSIYTSPGSPGADALVNSYAKTPRVFFGPSINTGDHLTTAKYESGGKLTYSDVSTSTTTLDGYGDIFDSTVVHSILHKEVGATEANCPDMDASVAENGVYYTPDGGGTFFPTNWPFIKVADYGSFYPGFTKTSRLETVSVTGTAKDYVFFDAENQVYVYFESQITADSSSLVETYDEDETSSATGSFALTVELVLESPQAGTVRATVFEYENDDATFSVNTTLPADIDQDDGNRVWKYVEPPLARPAFAPRWMNQGLCKSIAYTTTAEAESADEAGLDFAHRLLASFRLQILFITRPPMFPVPTVAGATQVVAPMLEALLQAHYGTTFFYTFSGIEEVAAVLNAAYPSGDPHAAIGVTGTNPNSEVYRT